MRGRVPGLAVDLINEDQRINVESYLRIKFFYLGLLIQYTDFILRGEGGTAEERERGNPSV